jgi:hypothetical protein
VPADGDVRPVFEVDACGRRGTAVQGSTEFGDTGVAGAWPLMGGSVR